MLVSENEVELKWVNGVEAAGCQKLDRSVVSNQNPPYKSSSMRLKSKLECEKVGDMILGVKEPSSMVDICQSPIL